MPNTKYCFPNFGLVFCLLSIMYCLLLFSCKNKKENLTLDYQYDYAPIDSGHFVIYDVDSIVYSYNGVQTNDTAHYQMMEQVGDTFYDNLNQLNYELNLYRRSDSTSSWVYDRKWSVKRTLQNYQKKEGDLNFVKLVFPPQEGKDWNGNVYIPTIDIYSIFLNWDYLYVNVGTPFSVNGLNFNNTLTVNEIVDSNAIEKTLRKEVYAKGVGMIYQEWELLTAGSGVVYPSWQTGKINGYRIRMKVVDHN